VGRVGKSREEIEVEVSDGEIQELLLRLGFREVATVKKRRRLYRVGDVLLSLDDVEGLGLFAEAEVRGDLNREEDLLDLLKKLGGGEPIRKSYLEMLIATL